MSRRIRVRLGAVVGVAALTLVAHAARAAGPRPAPDVAVGPEQAEPPQEQGGAPAGGSALPGPGLAPQEADEGRAGDPGAERRTAPPADIPADAASPAQGEEQATGGAGGADQAGPQPADPARAEAAADLTAWAEGLAAQSTGSVTLDVVGRTAAGDDLQRLVLGPAGEPGPLPTFVVLGDLPAHRAVLEAFALAGSDQERAVRASVRVQLLAIDRATLAGEDGAGASFPHDFPIGWVPAPLRADAGSTPLGRPEASALVALLRNTPEVVALLFPEGLWPAPGAEMDPAMGPGLEPAAPRGRPQDYAWHVLGIPSFGLPADSAAALDLFTARPDLQGTLVAVELLGDGQWRVDLELVNVGRLPSFTAPAARLRGASAERLTVAGARVVASAQAARGEPFELVHGRTAGEAWSLGLGRFAGGEARKLRLVLEAPEGAEAKLTVRGAWLAGLQLAVPLVP